MLILHVMEQIKGRVDQKNKFKLLYLKINEDVCETKRVYNTIDSLVN